MNKKTMKKSLAGFMIVAVLLGTMAPMATIFAADEKMAGNNIGDLKLHRIDKNDLGKVIGKSQKENLSESKKKLSTDLLRLIDDSFLLPNQKRAQVVSQMKKLKQFIAKENSVKTLNREITNKAHNDLVYVYIKLDPSTQTSVINSIAWEVTDRDEKNHLAVALVEVDKLETLASISGVKNIRSVLPPVVHSGSVVTEGDIIHQTDEVRSDYSQSGAGIKIGVISDGVDSIASAKSTGDLPSGVTVLSNSIGGDEGTAMLEIIYDMAPSASLYFHDAGSNVIAFNSAIDDLVAEGVNVIVDDVGWIGEPFFEDGTIASHVASVLAANNIVYVSAAGNNAQEHYQGDYYNDDMNFHDFSRNPTTNDYLYLDIPNNGEVTVILQWNDSFGHSGNDYDLILFNTNGWGLLSGSGDEQNGTGDPIEGFSYTNTTGSTITAEIDVSNYHGLAAVKTLELFILPSNGTSVYLNNITPIDSIFGHPAVPGVIAVGAIASDDPGNNTIEPFSSQGPVTIIGEGQRAKPDIAGIDKVSVTGAGGFYTPFSGTSAAAPHIAAIAAQLWGQYPSATGDQIRNHLLNTSVDLGATGFDNIFGYGRADSLLAFQSGPAITSFNFASLAPAVTGSINNTNHTIVATVPFGTVVTALVPAIAITGASVSPLSGVANNFTTPQTYTTTTASGITQVYTVTVTVASIQATPTFSPVAGAVAWGTTVTITSAGADAIYYTTNGDTPTTGSTLYTTPVTISSALTLKALAIKAGYTDSAIGSASYTQAVATAPSDIVLAVGSAAAVGGVTNVAIPAAGGTDTTGAVTGWITSTNDKIKFTVTDGGGASTITINAAPYTSGADYTIAAASPLTIIVTTTETGKATGVRTFTVAVAAAADSSALNSAISAANTLHDGATEGTAVGQYAVGSKATFKTAINAAEVIYTARLSKTQEQLNTAVSDLATADSIFDSAIVVAGDAAVLNTAIIAANTLHDGAVEGTAVGQYAVGSKATFNTAIDAAEVIYAARATKIQSQLDTAVSNLATADGIFDATLVTVGNATALNTAITAANSLHDGATEGTDYGQYASGSKATFNTAIDAAEVIYAARATKTQGQLDTAVSDLATADGIFDSAIVLAGNATALNDAITAANTLHTAATEGTDYGQYAVGSKATFNTAIDVAEVIYAARTTKSATQLSAAVSDLATADSIFDSAIVVAGDAAVLNTAIIAANTLHDGAVEGTAVGQYAVGSKATFNTAIDAAEVIYAARTTKSATQLAAAVSDLATADSTFDAALITEASLVAEYTNAANAAAFVTLLDANNLELILTNYAELDATGKTEVGAAMLVVNTFADKNAVQSAVTTAIANAKTASDGRIADIATVASIKTAITNGTYTNLEVVDLVQATKTAAVQVVVDSLKDTTTAVVTFVTPNYSVAISKGVASDTYVITTATFTLISKSALISAITAATANKNSVATSIDGTDVKSSNQWVTSGVKTTYAAAIATAQAVVDNSSASQGQIDGAVTTLAGATSTFNAAKASGSDDTAPTVAKIGDNSADVTIAAADTATLTFSEALSATGKIAVTNALTAGANKAITYGWNGDNSILTITGHATDTTTFVNDVIANVFDVAGNTAELLLIDSILSANQTTSDESGDSIVDNTTPQIVITNPNQAANITISSGTTSPTIDVSSFITNGTGLLPSIIITSANANNTTVAIPASTTITSADSTWNGVIAAPTVTTVTLPDTSGYTKALSTAIEIGFTGAKLSFDKAVRILFPGQAGKRAGYVRAGISFTEITSTCAADNQSTGDALDADSECKIDVGSDLVIWTKHFTSFATYTQTTNQVVSSGGGGSYTPTTTVTNTSIVIDGGAASVTSAAVTLTLGATNATMMAISNTADFTGGTWETYATSKAWTLTEGNGTKTVYAKFRDAAGISSSVISDTIILSNDQKEGAKVVADESIIDGDIIQCASSANPFAVYIVKVVGDTKYIRHIVSLEIFNHYEHLKWENLKQVDSLDNYSLSGWVRYNTGANYTAAPTDKVYEINGDQTKHWINMTAEQFLSHGGSEPAIFNINQGELDLYTASADVMSL